MTMPARSSPHSAPRLMIKVLAGPDKGGVYQLIPPRISIGRGIENDIALSDPRCSREQAVIEIDARKVTILDVSARQNMTINGQSLKTADLKHRDVIAFGDTELSFRMESPTPSPVAIVPEPPNALTTHARPGAPAGFSGGAGGGFSGGNPFPGSAPRSATSAESAKRVRFYVIIAALSVGLYVLLDSTTKKPNDDSIRTDLQIEEDIKNSEERQEFIRKRRPFTNDEDRERFKEADKHYLQGFRDYQKGQYSRAIKAFETARAIFPEHQLALRYLTLASRSRDEEIALRMVEGRRYKERNMFARCSGAMENVLKELESPQDLKYKEAVALKKECDLLLEEGMF